MKEIGESFKNARESIGITKEEVIEIMNIVEIPKEKQQEMLPIIKENYDGYVFSNMIGHDTEKYRLYNSNMTFYFLNRYMRYNKNMLPGDTNKIHTFGMSGGGAQSCLIF